MPNTNLGVGGGGSGTVTSVGVSGGTTGLSTSGGPITTSGTITLTGGPFVGGSGTTGNLAVWSSGSLANSNISDNGTQLSAAEPFVMLASTTGAAGLNLPAGSAPTSPADGDVWTTTAGMFVRINGVTVGPLAATPASNRILSVSTPVILTDSDIKALDPTSITILPAPGAGLLTIPWMLLLQADYPTTTSYTNLNPGGTEMGIAYVGGDALGGTINAANLLGTGAAKAMAISGGPLYQVPGVAPFGTDAAAYSDPNNNSDKAIELWMDNNAMTPLTGGNAGNTIQVTLWYMTVSLY